MNPLNIIATLRKFGNFLVGLFPFLAVVGEKLGRLTGVVWLEKAIAWLKSKERLAPIGIAIERFFWKDYARDRFVAETFLPGTLSLLRICSLVALALVVFMPLSLVISKPVVPIELNSGDIAGAPLWVVYLWMIAAPLGWGAIVAGAVQCHRIIFAAFGIACIYFVGSYALFLPRSYWNLIFPVAMFAAIHFSGHGSVNPRGAKNIGAVLSALAVGIPTGIFMVILTPLHGLFKPHTLIAGGVVGAILSLVALFVGNLDAESAPPDTEESPATPVAMVVPMAFTFAALMFAFVCSLVIRGGGPKSFGSQLISSLQLWNGYIWPLWYFVGVGIIYKVLKNAKIMTYTVRDLLPSRVFRVIGLALIVIPTIVLWSSTIGAINNQGLAPLTNLFVQVYKSTSWFWEQTLNRLSACWMQWVLLFDVIALLWMACRRQLTDDRLATMVYFTALSWLLIYEYNFQFSSFGQTVGHNVFVVIAFAMWLLWLFHTSVFSMCSQSTRSWPGGGRLGLYCGLITLCLLEINARTTIRDFKVTNEIFLMMFRGIIDIGLPYFLYVLSIRRFRQLPIRVLTIFQCFCAGALLTFPMIVLDKLALSGWSFYKFEMLWKQEIANMSNSAFIEQHAPILPESWLFVRALLFVGAMTAIFFAARNKLKDSPNLSAALIFALLSFASGFGSFSKAMVDLPLPQELKVLISPFTVSLSIDLPWVFTYLSALLPAQFFVLCVTARRFASNVFVAIAAVGAAAINFGLTVLYPGYESYLHSTGLMNTVVIAGLLLFIYMLMILVWRLEETAALSTAQKEERSESLFQEDEDAMVPSLQFVTMDDSAASGTHVDSAASATQIDSAASGTQDDSAASATQVDSGSATQVDSGSATQSAASDADDRTLIGKRALSVLTAIACGGLVAVGVWQAHTKRLVAQAVPAFNRQVKIPADWNPAKSQASATSTVFVSPGDPLNSTMEIGTLPSHPQGVEALAINLVQLCKSSKVLPNFAPLKMDKWKDVPGEPAVVLFSFTANVGAIEMPRMGFTVLVPREKTTEFFTIYTSADQIDERLGDAKRMVRDTLNERPQAR